jgi:hypothetical protein
LLKLFAIAAFSGGMAEKQSFLRSSQALFLLTKSAIVPQNCRAIGQPASAVLMVAFPLPVRRQ